MSWIVSHPAQGIEFRISGSEREAQLMANAFNGIYREENMKLKNDRERREFVNDPKNWETIGDIKGLIQMRMLRYKGMIWYANYIRQVSQSWNSETHDFNREADWLRVGMYQIDTEHRAFTYGISATEIVNAIKEADKS